MGNNEEPIAVPEVSMFGLQMDRSSSLSLSAQLTAQLREMILAGRIVGGQQLPPSRELAQELRVARNVVIQSYEQLLAEGYLESRVGAGTFVADLRGYRWPGRFSGGRPAHEAAVPEIARDVIDFNAGQPDLSRFPSMQWAKLLKEVSLETPERAFGFEPSAGEWSLRSAIAGYLFRAKGIVCRPEQILIVPGVAQAGDLLAKLFRPAGRAVALEDPCGYNREVFIHHGLETIPVPVDYQGIRPGELPGHAAVGLIYVVPSHQFPMGGVLPVQRRLQLLEYAAERDAYIVEDDYDSEFRYRGEPIQALRHLAPERVIYLGTFSKIFAPGLRLGFMVMPGALLDEACRLKEQLNLRTPSLTQLAMARFIDSRALDRHVYQMKKVYAAKRKRFIALLSAAFGAGIRICGENAGLHLVVEFQDRSFEVTDMERLLENGVVVDWVEDYAVGKGCHRHQLVLGYGGLGPEQLALGVERIAKTLAR
jgi:GntR family transcriptional regulator/MocR family aminotransferase